MKSIEAIVLLGVYVWEGVCVYVYVWEGVCVYVCAILVRKSLCHFRMAFQELIVQTTHIPRF